MRGVWIEIRSVPEITPGAYCHSPCGECGLKLQCNASALLAHLSLPMRGVWIEINEGTTKGITAQRHSPCGECGLKFKHSVPKEGPLKSLPMRGVWIEMQEVANMAGRPRVTPHAGSVD
mgnify:CR=1 FL=1